MGRRGRPPKVVSTPSSSISNKDDDTPSEKNSNPTIEPNHHAIEKPTEESVAIQEITESENLISPKGATEPRRLWVDVISGNRNPENGLALEFIAPKIVNGIAEVVIEEADTVEEVKF
ncbi:unnamed protein product [Lathyrus sativus]|nr:unnamed protein product [Lathyrus sativus]